jgi:hypothetical protein
VIKSRSYISLLLVAACTVSIGCNPGIIDVPPPTVTDASAYFFPKNARTVTFNKFDSITKTPSTFTLNFSIQDSGYTIAESGGYQPETFTGIIGSDAVEMSGLSMHSIIPLPTGYSIKPKSTSQIQTITIPLHHIIAVLKSSVIASNNDSGIYYSTNSGMNWSRAQTSPVKSTDPVTIFAAIGDRVYAATSHGNLIMSSGGGKNWSLVTSQFVGKTILAIAIDQGNGDLYISLSNNNIDVVSASSGLKNILKSANTLHFSSLACLSDTNAGASILVGGTDNGLYYRELFRNGNDSMDWTPTSISTGKIRSLIAANIANSFYCSAGSSIDSSPDGINWRYAAADTGMLAYDAIAGKVISWTNQGTIHVVNVNSTIPSINKTVNDFSASDGNYFAATNTGVSILTSQSNQWVDSSTGLTTTRTIGTEIPGSVVLLHSVTGSSPVDSSWEACTLLNQSKVPIIITGRILGHLDSLTIGADSVHKGGTTYADVIAVRYADESTPNNQISSIPYWVIYYSKNEGPLVISQMYGTTTLSRAIRQR